MITRAAPKADDQTSPGGGGEPAERIAAHRGAEIVQLFAAPILRCAAGFARVIGETRQIVRRRPARVPDGVEGGRRVGAEQGGEVFHRLLHGVQRLGDRRRRLGLGRLFGGFSFFRGAHAEPPVLGQQGRACGRAEFSRA